MDSAGVGALSTTEHNFYLILFHSGEGNEAPSVSSDVGLTGLRPVVNLSLLREGAKLKKDGMSVDSCASSKMKRWKSTFTCLLSTRNNAYAAFKPWECSDLPSARAAKAIFPEVARLYFH